MTTGTETAELIDFLQLDDLSVTDHDEEWGYGREYPLVLSCEDDGQTWLTDRHWILPKSLLRLPDDLSVVALTGDAVIAKMHEWIIAAKTGELNPPTGEFAPTYAGVLTLYGVEAFDCGITASKGLAHAPQALVRPDGARIGLLMPMREPGPGTCSLPVRPSMLAMYERIAATGVVRSYQAWQLAAYLTAVSA